MLKDLIPQLLMVISAGVILVVIGRRAKKSSQDFKKQNLSENQNNSEKVEVAKIKVNISKGLEKILRKTKIFILKSDTELMKIIKKLQHFRGIKEEQKEGKKDFPVKNERIEKRLQKKKNLLMNQVSKIKNKLTKSKEAIKLDINSLRKEKLLTGVKPIKFREIDTSEAKKVMFERQERTLIRKISLNPSDDKAYIELGKLYKEAGNKKDAEASFKQALKISKGNVIAKKHLRELEEDGS